jgi:uncharacterized membrane protein YdjX (TVP38/TMEM64 family)
VRLKPWGIAILVAAAIVVPLTLYWRRLAPVFVDPERLAALVRGAGFWGPAIIVTLQALQVILAPIPGQAVNFAAGYLFGFWPGVLYSWLGLLIGSAGAMVLARVLGRPLVTRFVPPATLTRLDTLAARRGLLFFLLVFLLPFVPDDAACFVAGLTPLPLLALLATAAIGRLPSIALTVWAGARAGNLPVAFWIIGGIAAAGALLIIWRYGEAIQDVLLRLAGNST